MKSGKFTNINIRLIVAILVPTIIIFGLLSALLIHEQRSTFNESMHS